MYLRYEPWDYLLLSICFCLKVYHTAVAAARYSSAILEMFYAPISVEENRRQNIPMRPEKLLVNFKRNQNILISFVCG